MSLRNAFAIAQTADWCSSIQTPETKNIKPRFGLGADSFGSDSFAPTNPVSSSSNLLNEAAPITSKYVKSANKFGGSYQSNQNVINNTNDHRVRLTFRSFN